MSRKRRGRRDEWIEQMRSSLRPHQFLRMIENRFVTTAESFIDMAWWDACTTGRQVVADASMPVWVAVDASVKRDSTAIAVCTWDKDTKRVRWSGIGFSCRARTTRSTSRRWSRRRCSN